jgi:Na+/alanine symporter
MILLQIINSIREFLWSGPLVVLLLGTGLFLTVRLGFIQFKIFGWLFQKQAKNSSTEKGDVSPFQALMTGLAGAIGTGTIAGIATAISCFLWHGDWFYGSCVSNYLSANQQRWPNNWWSNDYP